MTLLFDKDRPIKSPALAPAQDAFERAGQGELTIGLVNNMPDSALKATERQFMRLLQAAAGNIRVNFHCFSLPAVARSKQASEHIAHDYADIADLDRLGIDGLIVTGAEPIAANLPDEPFWGQLTEIIDWARTNTRSTIWSCLAAHAAVKHLDGVERHRLSAKCSGVYDCSKAGDDWLTRGLPATLKVSHSRYNELRESELAARGYEILTRSDVAGVDIFARQLESRFIFFQGHPEYDASSLQREYMRDLARFLNRRARQLSQHPRRLFRCGDGRATRKFRAAGTRQSRSHAGGRTARPDASRRHRRRCGGQHHLPQLARLPSRGSARACLVAEMIMPSWSNFRARLSNRLARHLFAAPMQLKGGQPMVSFTFDDIPVSAATVGAPMLEEFGGLGTFYVAGGLVNRRTDQGDGVDPDGIVKLRRSGHEIACHTFSHQRAIDLDATTHGRRTRAEPALSRRARRLDQAGEFRLPLRPRDGRAQAAADATASARPAASCPASTAAPSTCSSCARHR